jgi:Glyoxalase-like domain
VHLIAFGTAAAEADHERLKKGGFSPLEPVALQREIGTGAGRETARFTVVRVSPATMEEGRIQFCRHHTPELLWQERWLHHANRATALAGVILRVADAQEAAQRYARYTGLMPQVSGSVWRITTECGYLIFVDRYTLHRRLGVVPPTIPWIAGYVLKTADINASGEFLRRSGIPVHVLGSRRLLVVLPRELGGIVIFEPADAGVLNFD